MGAVQSFVESFALRPPPRPTEGPKLPTGAEVTTVRARYSNIPIYVLYGKSLGESGASASASASADVNDNKPWIILSHGSNQDCCDVIRFAETLAFRTSSVVVMYEYPGYGMSTPATTGSCEELPSEAGVYAAAREAYRYVTADRHIPADRVVAMGRSVGSGPAMELASTRDIAGVIIESAFRSVVRVRCWTPWSFGCDPFQNGDKAYNIDKGTRILILHGTEDPVVSISHGKYIYNTLKDKNITNAVWMQGRKHVDLALDPTYAESIRAFLVSITESASGIDADATREAHAVQHLRHRPVSLEMTHQDP